MKAGVPDFPVDAGQLFKLFVLFLVIQVGFIKDQDYRDSVCFGRCQEAVGESGGGDRVGDGDDQESLVYVSGDDVRLAGEVLGSADDVVFPFMNPVDQSERNWPVDALFFQKFKIDIIPYSNGASLFLIP